LFKQEEKKSVRGIERKRGCGLTDKVKDERREEKR
jgi:hypothetical protein